MNLRRLIIRIAIILACLIIVGAAVMASFQLLTPVVARYWLNQGEITQLLAKQGIQVGAIRASWRGIGPMITVEHVTWEASNQALEQPIVKLDVVQLRFNLFKGLWTKQWNPYAVRVTGGQVDGQAVMDYVDHLQTDASPNQAGDSLAVIHQLSRVQWTNVHLTLPHHEQTLFVETSGRIKNSLENYRFELTVQRTNQPLSVLEVTADIQGTLADWRKSSGTAYVAWYDTDMASLLKPYEWENVALQTGFGEISTWFDWEKGQVNRVQSVVDLKEIHVTTQNNEHQLAGNIAGHFLWQQELKEKDNSSWVLSADNLYVQLADKEMLKTAFRLKKSTLKNVAKNNTSTQYEFSAPKIELPIINQLAVMSDQAIAKKLAQFTLDGVLEQLSILVDVDELSQTIQAYAVRSRLIGLGIFSHNLEQIPEIQGVDGELSFTHEKGLATLYSHDMQVNYPHWGLAPITIHELRSDIKWKKQEQEQEQYWHVDLSDLALTTPDMQVYGNVQLDIPPDHNMAIDSQLSFTRMPITAINRYLPMKLLSNDLSSWLQNSLQGGDIARADVVLAGRLNDFPFTEEKGQFSVELAIEKGILQYDSKWPVIHDIEGTLAFIGNSMKASVNSAKLYDVKIGPTTVEIPIIAKESTEHLMVKGVAAGDLSSGFNYIKNSPLVDYIPPSLQTALPKGSAQFTLDFDLPLSETQPLVYLKGLLRTQDARIDFAPWNVKVNKIQGDLVITEQGVFSDKLQGQSSLGGPLDVSIKTIPAANNKAGYVELQGKTRLSVVDLAKWYPSSAWAYVAGSTDVAILLRSFEYNKGVDQLIVSSQLNGITSTLPDFLAKAPDTPIDFSLEMNWPDAITAEYHITYDHRLESRLAFRSVNKQWLFDRGSVGFNQPIAANWREKPGLLVAGHLKTVSDFSALSKMSLNTENAEDTTTTALLHLIREIKLSIDHLSLGGFVANHAMVSLKPHNNNWDIVLEAQETAGTLTIPSKENTAPIQIKLSTCYFIPREKGAQKTVSTLKPTEIPEIIFDCDAFHFEKYPNVLGRVHLKTKKIPSGLDMTELTLDNPQSLFSLTGQWVALDNAQSTHLKGTIKTKSFGTVFARMGVVSEVSEGKGSLQFDANIADSPLNASAAKLNANVTIDLKDGRIMQVNSAVGRVLNLFSLENLKKRLSLDFSDIFSEGFTFDTLTGQFLVQKGVVSTNNFNILASSADMLITGQTNLVTEQLNMDVTVIPHVTSTLPLAVGIATANPLIGAAVWLADKVVGSQLDKITQYRYHVTGSWDKPNVQPI